ncbi:IS66 family insertion sequence element accessory protein TnpB [Neorhizobium huautlense]|uniref:IS66 family insertion sequence element accessory protein TnpB n=1 Tax=Neorhizobium huautlense TaxID=67774 RepID=UPI000CF9C834
MRGLVSVHWSVDPRDWSHPGFAILVQETMALDPFAPAVFAFCNRRPDRMKLLFFDRSGFVLILKRLTEDKFRWPRREVAVVTLYDRTTALDSRRYRYRCDDPPSRAAISDCRLRWRVDLLTRRRGSDSRLG